VNAHQLTFPRFTLPFTQQAATTTGTRRPAAAAFEPARRGLPRSGQLRKSSKARARRQLQRPLDDAGIVPRAVYDATAQTTRGWNASAVDAPKISVENPWDQDTTLIRCQGFTDHLTQLAALTTAISSFGLDIKSAFIRPEGEPVTVDDIFYVTTRDGQPVNSNHHLDLVNHMEAALGMDPSSVNAPLGDNTRNGHNGHDAYNGSSNGHDYSNDGHESYGDGQDFKTQAQSADQGYDLGSSANGYGGWNDGHQYGASLYDPNYDPEADRTRFDDSYNSYEAAPVAEPEPEPVQGSSFWDNAYRQPEETVPEDSSWNSSLSIEPEPTPEPEPGYSTDYTYNTEEPKHTPHTAHYESASKPSRGYVVDADNIDPENQPRHMLDQAQNMYQEATAPSPPSEVEERFASAFERSQTDDAWNAPSWEPPQETAPQQTNSFSWGGDGNDYKPREDGYPHPEPYGGSYAPLPPPEDPAAVLSAQMRVAAAEMAAAAAEFVQLERERAGTTDASEIDRLQGPRLDAQATLERTMSSMKAMLAERDAMRNKAMGIAPTPEPEMYSSQAVVYEPRPYEAPIPRPYEAPIPRPYESPLPYESPRPYENPPAPEPAAERDYGHAPPQSFVEFPSMDEEDIDVSMIPPPPSVAVPPPVTPMGEGAEIMLQGFNWESCNANGWHNIISGEARSIRDAGFTAVWLPPPTKSVSDQGYLPSDLYNLNSFYGSEGELRGCIQALKDVGVCPVADIVINHRCAEGQSGDGRWNIFTGRMAWDQRAITTDNPEYGGQGNGGTGEDYGPAPNIDHTQDWVRGDIKNWLHWMKNDIGFGGWRFDFVKGYAGHFTGEYVGDTQPYVSVGEHWVSCNYNHSSLEYNQDSHRQSTYDWCNSTGGNTAAFDFTTKGILQEAVRNREYWRLIDSQGNPAGFCGSWPTHAVTFLENHDTGSTLQHWPFPTERLAEGYAYILTHPGTPTVFYDHWKDHGLQEDIQRLIDIRRRVGLKCNAAVQIEKAEDGCYAAHVGHPAIGVERGACSDIDMSQPSLCVKLGPADWSPNQGRVGDTKWKVKASGDGWAVWENVRFLSVEQRSR